MGRNDTTLMVRSENSPRYFFAHQAMKNLALLVGLRMTIMALEEQKNLRHLIEKEWQASNEIFGLSSEEYKLDIVTRKIVNDKWLILFSTPSPIETLDTYYCGYIADDVYHTRYFTVEKGIAYTFLGEWTKKGHLNYGKVGNDINSIMNRMEQIYRETDLEEIYKAIDI